jgi:hypothetical protein
MENNYEVLNPWGEVDPIPLRGIVSRLPDLKKAKIGLFCNYKRAARPILTVVEKKLKERFPDCKTKWYIKQDMVNILQVKAEDKARFDKWIKEVDCVIAAIGD